MTRFLTIDIGTSSMKSALFDASHTVLDFEIVHFDEESDRIPLIWQEGVVRIVKKFKTHVSNVKDELVIVISGHGPSTVYVDKEKNPIHYISWQSDQVLSVEHSRSYYLPQILFVKQMLPEIFQRTEVILSPAEYLSYLLTDKMACFIPNSELIPYIVPEQHILLHHPDIGHKLPPPCFSGKVFSQASSRWATQLHINHAKVVSGGLDYISAKLGAGAIDTKKIFQRSGTSVVINLCVDSSHIKEIENTNIRDTEMVTPSFILPSIISQWYNIGYIIPLYDELYTKAFTLIDTNIITSQDIVILLHKHRYIIDSIIDALHDNLQRGDCTMHDITGYVSQYVDIYLHGIVYVALLMHQVKIVMNTIETFLFEHQNHNVIFAVSGGHAANHTCMQLQAHALNMTIHTYTPLYTELRGNLYLGLHAMSQENGYQHLMNNVHSTHVFHPIDQIPMH